MPARSHIWCASHSMRRAEAQVVEQRRAQLLDDPALERHAGVERFQRAAQLDRDVAVALAQPLLGPGHVHLRGDEHPAQLVVDVAREARLLLLAHHLQVVGELRELAGAPLHLRLQPLALGHELAALLLALAHLAPQQPPHDEEQRDGEPGHHLHAQPRDLDVALPALRRSRRGASRAARRSRPPPGGSAPSCAGRCPCS